MAAIAAMGAPPATLSASAQASARLQLIEPGKGDPLGGGANSMRWQRLNIVAGKSPHPVCDEHQECVTGRLLQRFQEAVGRIYWSWRWPDL